MSVAAGWYADPENVGQLRYWNGSAWTDQRAPAPEQQHPPLPSHGTTDRSDTKSGVKIPLFGARTAAREATAEVERLRQEMARLGVLDVADLQAQRERLTEEIAAQQAAYQQQAREIETRLAGLRRDVVVTEETAVLQEVGIYDYKHPLSDSVAYRTELANLQDRIKTLAKQQGGAIRSAQGWTVNGSEAQGRKMVRDFSTLMLRAYNAEADNLARGLKPYKLASAVDRLTKVANTIARLGKTMEIAVSAPYHQLRVRELELTADFQQKLAEEKQREREERERLREERKVQQEIERERARLDKERQHYLNALQQLRANGDEEAAARLQEQLDDIDRAIADVDYRAANIRAGYVYVISNVGAFGDRMVKVGMTRRLEPMDRIRELGDASVPFKFDIHALFFSNDAVGIETQMHQRLAAKRVNKVNLRREFFYATPAEARDLLAELTGELLQFEELPEALEFHQSVHGAPASGRSTATLSG